MWEVRKSNLFKRQLLVFAHDYKEIAGIKIAERFINSVQNAIEFISRFPLACSLYHEARQVSALRQYEFRRWSLKGFPHTIFFRIEGDIILLEAIYAQRMDIEQRLPNDINPDDS